MRYALATLFTATVAALFCSPAAVTDAWLEFYVCKDSACKNCYRPSYGEGSSQPTIGRCQLQGWNNTGHNHAYNVSCTNTSPNVTLQMWKTSDYCGSPAQATTTELPNGVCMPGPGPLVLYDLPAPGKVLSHFVKCDWGAPIGCLSTSACDIGCRCDGDYHCRC